MKYVLDAAVAVKWVMAEVNSDKAEALRHESNSGRLQLLAPDIFMAEVAHSLTRAERQKRLRIGDAVIQWAEVMNTPPVLYPTRPNMIRAIEISSKFRIGVYDCIYVALAEQETCELITADEKLVRNLSNAFPFVIALSTIVI